MRNIKKILVIICITLIFIYPILLTNIVISKNENLFYNLILRMIRISDYSHQVPRSEYNSIVYNFKDTYNRYLHRLVDNLLLKDVSVNVVEDKSIKKNYASYNPESNLLRVVINSELGIGIEEQIKIAGENIEIGRDRMMERQIAQEEVEILSRIQQLKTEEQTLRAEDRTEELVLVWQSLTEELQKWKNLMERRGAWIKEGKIDLHTHSNISDAPDYVTPEELLRQATRTNVRSIAATEHNSIEGALALRELERKLLGEGILIDVVPGTVELSLQLANYDSGTKRDIHILLEFADFDSLKVREIIEEVAQDYKDGVRKTLDELLDISTFDELKEAVEYKLRISDEEVEFSEEEYQIIFQTIENLKNHPEKHEEIIRLAIKNDNLAKAMYLEGIYPEEDYRLIRKFTFDVWVGNASGYYSDAIEVLEKIRQVDPGASIVLAHPFWHVQDTERLISFLVEKNLIDGIEVEYTYYTEEQQQELYSSAEKYGLWASGGSDSHDLDKATKEDGRLGSGWNDNVNVTWQMLENLREKKSQFHYEKAMQSYQIFIENLERGDFDEVSFNSAIEEFMKSSVVFTPDGITPINRYNYQAYEKIIELYQKAKEYFERE